MPTKPLESPDTGRVALTQTAGDDGPCGQDPREPGGPRSALPIFLSLSRGETCICVPLSHCPRLGGEEAESVSKGEERSLASSPCGKTEQMSLNAKEAEDRRRGPALVGRSRLEKRPSSLELAGPPAAQGLR